MLYQKTERASHLSIKQTAEKNALQKTADYDHNNIS